MSWKASRTWLASVLMLAGCPKSDDPESPPQPSTASRGPTLDAAYEALERKHDRQSAARLARAVLAASPFDLRAKAFLDALESAADGRLHELRDVPAEALMAPEDERVRKPGLAFVHHLSAPFTELEKGAEVPTPRLLPFGLPVRVLELEEDRAKVELGAWISTSAAQAVASRWMLGDFTALEDPTEVITAALLGRSPPPRAEPSAPSSATRIGYVPLQMLSTSTVSGPRLLREAELTTGGPGERALRLARYAAREPRDRAKQRELLRLALEAEFYSLAVLAADDLALLSDPDRPFEWALTIDHHAYCRGRLGRTHTEWFDRVPELRPFPSFEYEVKRTSELAGRYLTEPRFDAATPSHGTDRDLCLVDAVLVLGPLGSLRVVGDSFHGSRCEATPVNRDEVLACVETRLSQVDEDTPPEMVAEVRRLLEEAKQGGGQLQFLSWTWGLREFPPDEVQELEAILDCLPGPREELRSEKKPQGLVDGDTLEGRTRRWLEETRRRFPQSGILRLSFANRRSIPATLGSESLVYRFAGSTCDCEARPTGVEFRRLPLFVVPPRGSLEILLRMPRPVGAGVEFVQDLGKAQSAIEALALPEGGSSDEKLIRSCLSYDHGCERPLPESSFARRFVPQRACCCP